MSPTKVAPTGSKKSKARVPSNKASGKFNWKAFNAELKSCGIKMSTVDGKWVPVPIAGSKRTPSTALSSLKPKPRSAAHVQEDDDFDDKDLAPLPPVRRKIRLSYAAKPKGSPGRKVGGYNLRQTLQMPQADYAIVYGMVKNMLIGQKGIDMTRPISFQNKLLISHITQKALKLFSEFEIYRKTGFWPLRAFQHLILRSSADRHKKLQKRMEEVDNISKNLRGSGALQRDPDKPLIRGPVWILLVGSRGVWILLGGSRVLRIHPA
ncbi:hypothetical protein FRC12_017944 [Ceratobasidium sp. 428]|nr:hypothetical protein FRC12_017944 [Ceratobasidium sp. 428]